MTHDLVLRVAGIEKIQGLVDGVKLHLTDEIYGYMLAYRHERMRARRKGTRMHENLSALIDRLAWRPGVARIFSTLTLHAWLPLVADGGIDRTEVLEVPAVSALLALVELVAAWLGKMPIALKI